MYWRDGCGQQVGLDIFDVEHHIDFLIDFRFFFVYKGLIQPMPRKDRKNASAHKAPTRGV